MAAAGNSGLLEDFEFSFSLSKEKTALKSLKKKGRFVQSFADRIRQQFNLSTSYPITCRGEFERQPFILPPRIEP